jgi:hypothetical protein
MNPFLEIREKFKDTIWPHLDTSDSSNKPEKQGEDEMEDRTTQARGGHQATWKFVRAKKASRN